MDDGGLVAAMGVLHLDTGKVFRGGQRQVLLLHRELLRRGWRSLVATPSASELAERCAAEGLPVLGLASRRGWDPRVLGRVLGAARGAVLVHAHDPHGAGIAAGVRRLGVGSHGVCHRRVGFPMRGYPGGPKYRWVDHWIAVTRDIADGLKGWGLTTERVSVVPSAVDLGALRRRAAARTPEADRGLLGLAAADPLVVACAALEPDKGVDVLVRAMPAVRATFPGAICAIAGDGPERPRLESLVRDLGLGETVRWLGHLREIAGLVAAADLCVVPSREREGSAATLKEPLALDRPLVASDLPAVREVVGEAARLAAPGDPMALAAALLEVLSDRGLRDRLVAAGRQRVEMFRPETMTERTIEIYERVLADAGEGA